MDEKRQRVDENRQRLAREGARLQRLAAWYRDWAEVAGDANEKAHRSRLAEYIEARARALLAAND